MNKAIKPLIYGGLIVSSIAVFAVVFLTGRQTTASKLEMHAESSGRTLQSKTTESVRPERAPGTSKKITTNRAIHEDYRRDDLSKVQFGSEWYTARGYDYADNESYMSYGDKELMALAISGDPVAEIQAISRFLVIPEHCDEIEMIHESAVLHGMTASLGRMIGVYELEVQVDLAADSDGEPGWTGESKENTLIDNLVEAGKDAALIKASVWALFAQMRGDSSGIWTIKRMHGEGELALSDEQIDTACSVANQLYEKLESKRLELGYREYSNDAPRLSHSDLGAASDLCDSWPTAKFECVQDSVRSANISVTGYRCVPYSANDS